MHSSRNFAPHGDQSSSAAFIAALVLTVIGGSMFNVMPLLTAGAANTLGFSDRQVGVMSLVISLGSGASALLAIMWVRTVRWPRAAVVALGGMIVTNLLAMLVHRYWVFVLLLGAAGFFAAAVICLAVTILSDRQESERGFGMANALQVVYQICGFLAGPTLLRVAGLNGVLAVLVALSGLAMLLVPLLPAHGRMGVSEKPTKDLLKPATLLALLGFAIFFVNAGGYWTYIEIMGEASGMTPRLAANCVAGGVSAGIVGGIAAWALGNRFGVMWPLISSALLTIGAALLLKGSFGVVAFILSVVLYFLAWNYVVAYQLSIVNAVDATGRAMALTQACAFLGAAAGAGLAAFFVTPGHYESVIWVTLIAVCASTVLFALSLGIHRYAHERHDPSPEGAEVTIQTAPGQAGAQPLVK